MEKTTLGLGAAAAIAAWAFFSFSGTHDAERAEVRARVNSDAASFDARFADAWGRPKPEVTELEKKAEAARMKAEEATQNSQAVAAAEQQKRNVLQSSAEGDLAKSGGPDLAAFQKNLKRELKND